MKKENFVKLILAIEKQEEIDLNFVNGIKPYFDSHLVYTGNNDLISTFIEFLKEEMNDKDDFIEWYLYELPMVERLEVSTAREVYGPGGEVIAYLDSAEALYDFLIKHYGQ